MLKIPNASCFVHMNRKPLIKCGIFQVGAWTNLKYFMRNHLFPKKCTVQGIRESQIAQNQLEIFHEKHLCQKILYRTRYNEESFKLGHAPILNISLKIIFFKKGVSDSGKKLKIPNASCLVYMNRKRFMPGIYE